MSEMKFAMIEKALHDRVEWRAMSDSLSARYTYLIIRTSTRLNYAGCYRYPLSLLSYETRINEQDLPDIINRLISERLIEYDHASGWVRIENWYYGTYAPENASKVKKWSRFYLEHQFPQSDLATNSVAEFVVGTLRRAGNFHEDSRHAEAVYHVLERFIRNASQLFSGLPQALERELYQNGQSTWQHLRGRGDELLRLAKNEAAGRWPEQVCQGVATLSAPCREGDGTVRPQKEREREREKEKETCLTAPKNITRPLQVTLDSPLVRGIGVQ
ncbi:hypothetical protein [Albirhodobacter sp. R86504]|uniref:hypothetical protein n=1 Tax=Albirhodobacter sp. R86504 TaxID=3093848 RepID=UPI00366B0439